MDSTQQVGVWRREAESSRGVIKKHQVKSTPESGRCSWRLHCTCHWPPRQEVSWLGAETPVTRGARIGECGGESPPWNFEKKLGFSNFSEKVGVFIFFTINGVGLKISTTDFMMFSFLHVFFNLYNQSWIFRIAGRLFYTQYMFKNQKPLY